MDAQNNSHLQEENNDAVIADYSSALLCKKYHMFGLEKKE